MYTFISVADRKVKNIHFLKIVSSSSKEAALKPGSNTDITVL